MDEISEKPARRRKPDPFCEQCDVSLDLHYSDDDCEAAGRRADLIGSFYSRVMQ